MASRLKRRSSLGGRHVQLLLGSGSGSTAVASDTALGDNSLLMDDDTALEEEEQERKRRQNKRNSILVNTNTPKVATPQAVPLGGTTALSAAQLAEHYTNCMKMSAENKISMKNAFQLRLIDTMSEMIKKKTKDMDNFQSASIALDASTKIYAYRVDNVHHETHKLASGVGSAKQAGDGNTQQGSNGEDGQDGEGKAKKKRKRRANTVEKNLANINMPKFDLEFDTDPLFKKISAQFDSGGGGGQFLHTLPMRDDSCQLLLDSGAVMASVLEAVPQPEPAFNAGDVDEMSLPKLEPDTQICPDFAAFSFQNWSLADDDELNQSLSALDDRAKEAQAIQMRLDNDEHAFDPNDLPEDFGGDSGGGDGGFGGGDFDDIANDRDDEEDQDDGIIGNRNKPRMAMTMMGIQHLREHLALVPSEYSYFDQGRLGAWAGPQHWKFKAAPMRVTQRTGTDSEKAKSKKKKEVETLDFEDMFNDEKRTLELAEKALTVPKKAIKLQNKTIESWNDEKNLLPEDLHYSGSDFIKLECLPKIHLGVTKSARVDEDDVGDYDFDNLNDSQNYCPDVGGDDNGGIDQTNGFFSQTLGVTDTQEVTAGGDGFDGEGGLVVAPNRIEKIQIGYAKLAKKVDMRRLKRVEWSILMDTTLPLNKTVENNKENETVNAEVSTLESAAGKKFSDVFGALKKAKDQMPEKMIQSLSVPLAFVALLHLCNEETLQLDNMDMFEDLTIRKG